MCHLFLFDVWSTTTKRERKNPRARSRYTFPEKLFVFSRRADITPTRQNLDSTKTQDFFGEVFVKKRPVKTENRSHI
uniref:Uncharacterized protein n=1 Tax=Globodera rostochiensis TaxID=31243 RepID=A0A914HQ95_GLORO